MQHGHFTPLITYPALSALEAACTHDFTVSAILLLATVAFDLAHLVVIGILGGFNAIASHLWPPGTAGIEGSRTE